MFEKGHEKEAVDWMVDLWSELGRKDIFSVKLIIKKTPILIIRITQKDHC